MQKTAVITLKFNVGTTDEKIQKTITNLYAKNRDAIEGMAFYQFEEEKILDEVKRICEKK